MSERIDASTLDIKEKVVHISRVAKVVKGGRTFRFSALVVVGDENGKVRAFECVEMALGEPDASGRRRPIEKAGSKFLIDVDAVIISIGTIPNPLIKATTEGLDTTPKGCIVADENGTTSLPGVFAGGDAVTGAATVILAMGAGKKSAEAIHEYIQNKTR